MKLEFHQKVKKNCPRQDWTLSIFEVDSIHRKKGFKTHQYKTKLFSASTREQFENYSHRG